MSKSKVIWDESGFSSGAGIGHPNDIAGLVERLRGLTVEINGKHYSRVEKLCQEAADALEQMQGKIEQLRTDGHAAIARQRQRAEKAEERCKALLERHDQDIEKIGKLRQRAETWEGLATHNRDAALEAEQRAERAEAERNGWMKRWEAANKRWLEAEGFGDAKK